MALRKVPRIRPTLQVPQVWLHRTIEGEGTLAKVMVSVKIFPSNVSGDLNELRENVRKSLEGKASIYKFEQEPIAFGLEALIAHILLPEDNEGQMDEVEERLKGIGGVSEVQVLVTRRIS